MNRSVKEFFDSLTPDDTGCVTAGKQILRFEGFTDECWDEAVTLGKTVESLEQEILREWASVENSLGITPIESGWWTKDIFYAIYPRR